jgi:probable phosphoglycerate mutase
MSKTVYLLRHGETDYNLKGIVQGSGVNSSLNDTGRQQAAAFYERYREVPFELVVTSRLKRTYETVRPFIESGLTWVEKAEINEMSWGIHEGKLASPEMIASYQEMKEGWLRGDYSLRIEGGESAAELGERLERFIAWLRRRPEELILVCSHGRALCALVTLMQGEPLSEMNKYRHSNTGLWRARQFPNLFQFDLENDRRHLPLPERSVP